MNTTRSEQEFRVELMRKARLLHVERSLKLRTRRWQIRAVFSGLFAPRRSALRLWLKWSYWLATLKAPSRFQQFRQQKVLQASGLFDPQYYLRKYPDVAQSMADPLTHYLNYGAAEKRDPSAFFCTSYYLRTNPDVVRSGMNPLFHFLNYGLSEGRAGTEEEANTLPDLCTPTNSYETWVASFDRVTPAKIAIIESRMSSLPYQPKLSVVMPTYNTPEKFLREAIDSVKSQIYPNWELCIADDASTDPKLRQILQEYQRADSRIKVVFKGTNGHISEASNEALALTTGDYVAFLDHDDTLHPEALSEIVFCLNEQGRPDVIYSDEDHINVLGDRTEPFFKPDFSPSILNCLNYICHFLVVSKSRILETGGFKRGYEGSQDHDLLLRLRDAGCKISHIPRVLYHWREHPDSVAMGGEIKSYAHKAGVLALNDSLKRQGIKGRVENQGPLFRYRIIYDFDRNKLVSILIPFRDKPDLLRVCVESIVRNSSYQNFEILLLDNDSVEQKTKRLIERLCRDPRIRLVPCPGPFNFAAINNRGAREATGSVLVFLNNDTEIIEPGWLEELMMHALRPGVGPVGCMLLYSDHTIQHAGVVIGMSGLAGHVYLGSKISAIPEWVRNSTREVSAVTAACLAIAKTKFEQIGSFDEAFTVCGNDVELCLRSWRNGFSVLFTPFTKLIHHESKTRDPRSIPEVDFVNSVKAYAPVISRRDPYYNPNLSLMNTKGELRLLDERPWLGAIIHSLPGGKDFRFDDDRYYLSDHDRRNPSAFKYSGAQEGRGGTIESPEEKAKSCRSVD